MTDFKWNHSVREDMKIVDYIMPEDIREPIIMISSAFDRGKKTGETIAIKLPTESHFDMLGEDPVIEKKYYKESKFKETHLETVEEMKCTS